LLALADDDGNVVVLRFTAEVTTQYSDIVAAALSAVGRADTRVTFVAEGAPRE
jgi:hypothetical protein